MWNSFQGALEKRVRNSKKAVVPDKYIIDRTVKAVLFDLFGQAGKENLTVVSVENGCIKIKSEKSIWRSELNLNKRVIIEKIGQQLGRETVKHVSVLG